MNGIVNDKVMKDSNGFLRADSVLFSAGVMKYSDGKGGTLTAFMPPEEVEKSLNSFAGNPVTNDHPDSGLVTPENYKELAVGYVDGASLKFENGLVKGHVVVCSDDGVEALEGGKHDVSLGYREVKDFTPGIFIDEFNVMGEGHGKAYAYDYVKRDIKINHLALVDEGRSKAAELIFDAVNYTYPQEAICLDSTDFQNESIIENLNNTIMTDNNKSIVLNDEVLEVSADAAEPILKLRDAHKEALVALDTANGEMEALKQRNSKLEKDMVEYDTMKGELEALKALKKKEGANDSADSPDVIADAASARLAAWNLVNSLSNDSIEFVPTNSPLDTKRNFIEQAYEVENIKDASEAFIDGMLQVLGKTNTKTVSSFVKDSAPSPSKETQSGFTVDSFEDGSFGIAL